MSQLRGQSATFASTTGKCAQRRESDDTNSAQWSPVVNRAEQIYGRPWKVGPGYVTRLFGEWAHRKEARRQCSSICRKAAPHALFEVRLYVAPDHGASTRGSEAHPAIGEVATQARARPSGHGFPWACGREFTSGCRLSGFFLRAGARDRLLPLLKKGARWCNPQRPLDPSTGSERPAACLGAPPHGSTPSSALVTVSS